MNDVTLGNLLLDRFRWFDAALLSYLRREGFDGIRRRHSLVFAQLDREGDAMTISALARSIGVTRQSLHGTVRELEAMGLIDLEPDPTNASARLVRPTNAGRRSIELARRRYTSLERELARRIGRANMTALRRALERDWGDPPA